MKVHHESIICIDPESLNQAKPSQLGKMVSVGREHFPRGDRAALLGRREFLLARREFSQQLALWDLRPLEAAHIPGQSYHQLINYLAVVDTPINTL